MGRNRYYIADISGNYIAECDGTYESMLDCTGNWRRYSVIYQSMIKDLDAEFTSCPSTENPTVSPIQEPTANTTFETSIHPTLQPIIFESVKNSNTNSNIFVILLPFIAILFIGCCSLVLYKWYTNNKKRAEIAEKNISKTEKNEAHVSMVKLKSETKVMKQYDDQTLTAQKITFKRQETEDMYDEKESIKLLRLWGLEQYTEVLIVNAGSD